ncbi:unnamed protein product [Aspergillus oryzae RIB40]|uniref:alpha-L-rhamnosidase n=1 Tax=Aspergillus oryzae (strain ATCC 42149 / RIB 40) TaxID=510516 RepID=Q2U5G6_ASPOR|nr:unnamed protein product [Aspergillus oryzae RIB40]BAE63199.1 unnamed protein product [Aspergillus oryzae RIB40]
MSRIAGILGKEDDRGQFAAELKEAWKDFQDEYVTPNGRIASDSQAAYALAICFDLLTPNQRVHAGNRLVELVRKNEFKIGTGFAGTPYLCEALTLTGHIQVAYSMLLEKKCPSWLYPVTMGATTVWERWDSMLPDGSINPGEMTSFQPLCLWRHCQVSLGEDRRLTEARTGLETLPCSAIYRSRAYLCLCVSCHAVWPSFVLVGNNPCRGRSA